MVPSFEFEYDDDFEILRPQTQTQGWMVAKYKYGVPNTGTQKPQIQERFAYYMSAPHLKLPNTVPHQINELSE